MATTLAVRPSGDLVVMGPRTQALYYRGEPGRSCVQLRLQPGVPPPLAGRRVREIADIAVPFADVGGLGHELGRIAADPDPLLDPDAVRRLELALRDGLPAPSYSDLVRDAAQLLAGTEPERVRSVARQLAISERHLRNLFERIVGISPRQYMRIDRVRTVLGMAQYDRLVVVAQRAGYYDQSHMTTDFRRLMGVPPGAFLTGTRPPPSPCQHR